jgi:hypothetical protein
MAKHDRAAAAADSEIHITIVDQAELTPSELAQERSAALAERARLAWLADTPEQLARRIPVSVFAMGCLVRD